MSLASSPTDPHRQAAPDPFRHELRVRYGECDPQGIGPWQEMVERGIDAVVAEASLEFRAPARFDDVLTLTAQVTRLGRTAITTDIDVLRGEDPLVHGRLRHVCVSTDTWRKTDMPDWVRAGLRRFASAAAESDDAQQ
jgi:acyl-CoA thioester hydrolase